MLRLALVAGLGLPLCGCLGLPLAAEVPIWVGVGGGVVAAGNLAVNADHDCHLDGGCKALPLPR